MFTNKANHSWLFFWQFNLNFRQWQTHSKSEFAIYFKYSKHVSCGAIILYVQYLGKLFPSPHPKPWDVSRVICYTNSTSH